MDDGPAAWVYDLTRTVPDMIASYGYDLGSRARRFVEDRFTW